MGWADGHIARLALGETIQFRPRGHSMTGKVNDGQLCTVEPLGGNNRGGINGWVTRRQIFGRLIAVAS